MPLAAFVNSLLDRRMGFDGYVFWTDVDVSRPERLQFGCSSRRSQSIVPSMSRLNHRAIGFLPKGTGTVILILIVCICVVSQMLGLSVTLLGLLMSDTPVESFSKDFSILPITPEPGILSHAHFAVESHVSLHLPIFSTAVFHPPQS